MLLGSPAVWTDLVWIRFFLVLVVLGLQAGDPLARHYCLAVLDTLLSHGHLLSHSKGEVILGKELLLQLCVTHPGHQLVQYDAICEAVVLPTRALWLEIALSCCSFELVKIVQDCLVTVCLMFRTAIIEAMVLRCRTATLLLFCNRFTSVWKEMTQPFILKRTP